MMISKIRPPTFGYSCEPGLNFVSLQTMGVTARYSRAHGDQALDVTFFDSSAFASCSQDGLVAMWDIRQKGNRGGELTSCSFVPVGSF